MNNKPRLSFWNIWNMSFGFLGIQFGFALQGGNMSRIFQSLGAAKDDIPMLWIAAPLTGLLVQPIIGYLSDRTWHPRFGRRRPFFLIGAILASLALFVVPNSWALWVAAGMLWILDASINISMEPFRALVADKLPKEQRTYGFIVQTLIIGIGTWVASNLPWFINKVLKISNTTDGTNVVGANVKYSFYVGGVVFLASILYTIFTTKEYPPQDLDKFYKEKEESKGLLNGLKEIFSNIFNMPKTMLQIGLVQFCSWFAFFAMWSMATPAITEHIFNAPVANKSDFDLSVASQKLSFEQADLAYNNAADLVSSYFGTYGLISMVVALLLAFVTSKIDINRKLIHSVSLAMGGLGFVLMYYIPEPWMLHICFTGIGIAWASILSMPYAMLAGSIDPKKMGVYMGIFNMFIVIPQIVAALGGVNLAYTILGEATINTMIFAGIFLFAGAICTWFIQEKEWSLASNR